MDRSLESRLIDEIIKERDLLRLSRDQINQEVLSLRNKLKEAEEKSNFWKQQMLAEGRIRSGLEEQNTRYLKEIEALRYVQDEYKHKLECALHEKEAVEKGIQQAIEAAVKALQEEIRYLSDENLLLRKELEREKEERKKIHAEKEQVVSELEDLTRSLFEEANKLVSQEARQKHEAEVSKKKLELENEELRNQLEAERLTLMGLKMRLLEMGNRSAEKKKAATIGFKPTRSRHSRNNSSVLDPTIFEPPPSVPQLGGSPSKEAPTERDKQDQSSDKEKEKEPEKEARLVRRRPTITSTRELRASLSTSSVALDGERSGADDDSAEVTSGEVLQIELRADYAFTPQFTEFREMIAAPSDSGLYSHPLFLRMLLQDVLPCLDGRHKQRTSSHHKPPLCSSKALHLESAIRSDTLVMAPLKSPLLDGVCAFCKKKTRCDYQLKLDEKEEWRPIGRWCRERIIAVCDTYAFLRHLRMGLIQRPAEENYKEFLKQRIRMCVKRIVN